MRLKDLMVNSEYVLIQGSDEVEVNDIYYNSQKASTGGVFVCIEGMSTDGHLFVEEVCAKGITAVIIAKDIDIPEGVTALKVQDSRKVLAQMSAIYFGYPAKELTTIGVTGTKGKTSTTYMVKSILEKAGYSVGLIGTIEIIRGKDVIEAEHTTPESYTLQMYLRSMVDAGCNVVVMEVSSQALMLSRVWGITFDYGVFTNLDEDHIGHGEHKDFEDYAYWKSMLFQKCNVGVFNQDDLNIEKILEGHSCQLQSFGMKEGSDYQAIKPILFMEDGLPSVEYDVMGNLSIHVKIRVPGCFNIYNSLAAIAVCNNFNVSKEQMQRALLEVKIEGRAEPVNVSEDFSVMIDYAHNAMALENLLNDMRKYNPKRLVTVFGCGGNRDRNRRFQMGEIASNLSDFTIVTSDNPRNEDLQSIIDDILVGMKRGKGKYVVIPNRREAIEYAIGNALEGDLIIVAGKGHEKYQLIGDEKKYFDDKEVIEMVAEVRKKADEKNNSKRDYRVDRW